jgi:glycosyltransferase involved in cell wall biosynthesis
VLFLTGKNTFGALAGVEDIPIVADCCDTAHVRLREEVKDAHSLKRLRNTLQYMRVRSIEHAIAHRTPYVVFASERDRVCLLPDGGVVIPQGVDFEYWRRRAPPAQHNRLLFTGVMNYPPNHDAALRLCRTIFPQVQRQTGGCELVIAGRDPLPELVEAARRQPNVTVTGTVPDLRPYLEQAAVFVAPIRYASGMQNKVLEAMAMEVPVVTNTAVAAGLQVASDVAPVITADKDGSVALAVIALLHDQEERSRLAREGYAFVRRHFIWSRNAEKLERLWMKAAGLDDFCNTPIYAGTSERQQRCSLSR